MRGIKEKIAENLSYINPVSRRMLLGAVIIFELLFTLAVCALLLGGARIRLLEMHISRKGRARLHPPEHGSHALRLADNAGYRPQG